MKYNITPPPPQRIVISPLKRLNRLRSVLLWCLAVVSLLATASPVGAVAGYGDVADGQYYTKPVQWSVDNDITGIDGSCFAPDALVTRGEASVYIWNMQNQPVAPAAHSFDDVTVEEQNAAVSWMVHTGISTGTSPTTFSPDTALTRAQLVTLLWRLAGKPSAPIHGFDDVQAAWQQGSVAWAANQAITTGTTPTTFSPDTTLTRAHLVTFLYRYNNSPKVDVSGSSPRCAPSGRFTSIAAGTAHACGIRFDGTVQCWIPLTEGADPECEFGSDGSLACRQIDYGLFNHGQENAPAGMFSQIAVAPTHVCGLRSDGSMVCWGDSRRLDAPAGTFTSIAISQEQNCGLRGDGAVRCRDYTGHGPPLRGLDGRFTSIIGGNDNGGVCGIRTDNTVDCWATLSPDGYDGHRGYRHLAMGSRSTCGIRTDGTVNCSRGDSLSTVASLNGSISGGGQLTCERRAGGELTCSGNIQWTQAPTGWIPSAPGEGTCSTTVGNTTCWSYVERTVAPAGTFTSNGSGAELTCERRADGTITCSGHDQWMDAPAGTFSSVAAGGNVICGIRADGTIACWGNRDRTDLPADSFALLAVGRATDFNDIPPACGIRTDGTVECWGNRLSYDQPEVPTGTFTSLAAGVGFMCGIRTDGTAKCWVV